MLLQDVTALARTDEVDPHALASAAVQGAPEDQKAAVAAAAVNQLSAAQRAALQKSLWPQDSGDRKWVYVAGFASAAAVAIGLGLVAWGAHNTSGVANSIIVLATAFTSAMLGGLFGAYKGGGS